MVAHFTGTAGAGAAGEARFAARALSPRCEGTTRERGGTQMRGPASRTGFKSRLQEPALGTGVESRLASSVWNIRVYAGGTTCERGGTQMRGPASRTGFKSRLWERAWRAGLQVRFGISGCTQGAPRRGVVVAGCEMRGWHLVKFGREVGGVGVGGAGAMGVCPLHGHWGFPLHGHVVAPCTGRVLGRFRGVGASGGGVGAKRGRAGAVEPGSGRWFSCVRLAGREAEGNV